MLKKYLLMYGILFQVLQKPSVEARQHLTVLSRQVANAVADIVHSAEAIKGSIYCQNNQFCFLILFNSSVVLNQLFILSSQLFKNIS